MLLTQEKYWTPKEVAGRFKVSEETVRRLIREKRLAAVKFGNSWRVSEDAIQRYLDSQQDKK